MPLPIIELRGVSKQFPGVRALDNVSLTIPPGMYGLLGPNGAGKSTLMRTIATLQEPDAGKILLGDIDVLRPVAQTRNVAFLLNDRADLVRATGCDGAHVGQEDMPAREARRLMGPDAIVGFSSHNAQQLCAAGGEPVDYVALGPVFGTASKRQPDPFVAFSTPPRRASATRGRGRC